VFNDRDAVFLFLFLSFFIFCWVCASLMSLIPYKKRMCLPIKQISVIDSDVYNHEVVVFTGDVCHDHLCIRSRTKGIALGINQCSFNRIYWAESPLLDLSISVNIQRAYPSSRILSRSQEQEQTGTLHAGMNRDMRVLSVDHKASVVDCPEAGGGAHVCW
jgi:hypothetical protein